MLSWISSREKEEESTTEEKISLSPRLKLFRDPQVQAFVAWIQEEESEEEDDDDEDDEDEDD